jgi:lysozyme
MKTANNGIELIKKYEGFMSNPYKCPAGVPTIGYGATYYPNGERVKMNDNAISEYDAELLLKSMIQSYEAAVNRYVQVTLTQNQFDALVSFAYNLGNGALQKSTLLKRVNEDPSNPDITNQFNKWVKAGGKTLSGLVKRRKEEAELYFS